ncbi:MAG TPA: DUF2171 domain-containing protein [Lautropia sp.]|jgi:hypothetical protein|nr:DUF2171 domain-containing protein [Lautropia sp.]
MADLSQVKEHMIVIGADGTRVGVVDKVEGDRIKLTKDSSPEGPHSGHHHYLPGGLVAAVEGNNVRLSSNGSVALLFEEEGNRQVVNTTSQASVSQSPSPRPQFEVSEDKPVWNWNKLGIGAATLGLAAAAGAAYLTRKTKSEDDFELRLETDETVRLISSDKVEGTAVVDRDGKTLGHIKSFMVDKYTGRVAYAIMSFGGTAGFGASLFPLPWPLLEYDVSKDGYALDITKEQMAQAPRFEASSHPEFTADYRRTVIRFYRPMTPATAA